MKTIQSKLVTLLAVITLSVYLQSSTFQFVLFDDDLHVFRNPKLLVGTSSTLKEFWTEPYKGFYIPMTYSLWSALMPLAKTGEVEKQFPVIDPFLFHLTNVILHTLNALLCFFILSTLFQSPVLSFFGGLLFSLHPLQVETVAWVTALKDLLACFFALVACLLYFRRKVFSYIAPIFFLLALLSKPAVVFLPLFLFAVDVLIVKRPWKNTVLLLVPWFLLILPFITITQASQPIQEQQFVTPAIKRPFVLFDTFGFYLVKLFMPLGLAIDYSRSPKWVLQGNFGFYQGIAFVLFTGLCIYLKMHKTLVTLILFLIPLLPVSGLIPFSFQVFSTVADHYAYFAVFSISLCFAWALKNTENTKHLVKCAIVVTLLLGARTITQLQHWKSSDKILGHTIRVNPRSIIAHNNLAVFHESRNEMKEAESHYKQALESGPEFAHHHYNVGNILMRQERTDEALPYLYRATQQDPLLADPHFNLAVIMEALGELKKAENHAEKYLSLAPLSPRGHFKLAMIQEALKKYEDAKKSYEMGLALDPNSERGKELYAKFSKKRR